MVVVIFRLWSTAEAALTVRSRPKYCHCVMTYKFSVKRISDPFPMIVTHVPKQNANIL